MQKKERGEESLAWGKRRSSAPPRVSIEGGVATHQDDGQKREKDHYKEGGKGGDLGVQGLVSKGESSFRGMLVRESSSKKNARDSTEFPGKEGGPLTNRGREKHLPPRGVSSRGISILQGGRNRRVTKGPHPSQRNAVRRYAKVSQKRGDCGRPKALPDPERKRSAHTFPVRKRGSGILFDGGTRQQRREGGVRRRSGV